MSMNQQTEAAPKSASFKWVAGTFVVIALILGIDFAGEYYMRSEFARVEEGCVSNLEKISAALRIYANDNAGEYPATLNSIVPRYLPEIPDCHERRGSDGGWGYQSDSKNYTLTCEGIEHKDMNAFPPRYTSRNGLEKNWDQRSRSNS
jgi:hypothetical protein